MKWALALALVIATAACGPARRSEPLTGQTAAPQSPQLALGERAFHRECSQCHPKGETGLGPAINNKPLPEWLMKIQIRSGLGAMPSFGPDKVSDEEVDAIVAWLKSLRRA